MRPHVVPPLRLLVYAVRRLGGRRGLGPGPAVAGGDPVGSAGIKGLCLGRWSPWRWAWWTPCGSSRCARLRAPPRASWPAWRSAASADCSAASPASSCSTGTTLALLILGWVLTGLMVGAALGSFDFLRSWVREEEPARAGARCCAASWAGRSAGCWGASCTCSCATPGAASSRTRPTCGAPAPPGFVALGLCIGLMIGVAQVVLKEAWLHVEAGFRAGRELLLTRPVLTIGRAEACDLGLFGDPAVERLHARIVRQGDRYLIADAGTAGGTYVNDVRIEEPTPLRSGDLIRVGKR